MDHNLVLALLLLLLYVLMYQKYLHHYRKQLVAAAPYSLVLLLLPLQQQVRLQLRQQLVAVVEGQLQQLQLVVELELVDIAVEMERVVLVDFETYQVEMIAVVVQVVAVRSSYCYADNNFVAVVVRNMVQKIVAADNSCYYNIDLQKKGDADEGVQTFKEKREKKRKNKTKKNKKKSGKK
ncbi:hypothetical protein BDC45DRAFT_504948 [Circinella umbellata]|nr:hypothetical protein BDC45DRAFT_504948 [Circinella umbellata]